MPRPARLPALRSAPPPGWVRLSEAYRDRVTLFRWVSAGLIPSRRVNAKRCYVDPAAVAALAAAWPCPACKNTTPGPIALAVHVRALHARLRLPGKGWRCPGPGCAARLSDAESLAVHLAVHARERKAAGITERPVHGGTPRTTPRPKCKRRGCSLPSDARGLCPTHYQADRRARMKRAGGRA